MTDKQHPADAADIEKIAQATHFTIHLRSGPHDKTTKRAKTLPAAVRAADKLGKTTSGKRPMIYAVTADKMTVHVPAAMIAQARQEVAAVPRRAVGKATGHARSVGAPRSPRMPPRASCRQRRISAPRRIGDSAASLPRS